MSNIIEQELCNLGVVTKTVYISQYYKDPLNNELYLLELDRNNYLKNKYVIKNPVGEYGNGLYEITYYPEDALSYNAIPVQSIKLSDDYYVLSVLKKE